MTESVSLPADCHDLQPSARFVYRELQRAEGPLTVQDLRDRTGYSVRGLRHATTALLEEDLINSHFEAGDTRRKQFVIRR